MENMGIKKYGMSSMNGDKNSNFLSNFNLYSALTSITIHFRGYMVRLKTKVGLVV